MAENGGPAAGSGELHLFILWDGARSAEDRILNDIASRFRVVLQRELRWTRELFSDNLTRFYGLRLPPGSFKEEHVGSGPLLLVVVEDDDPLYEVVETSRGDELVNSAVFAAKQRYRDWTGGGHRVHATNSPAEFEHDITLLLGRNTADFRAGVHPAFALGDRAGVEASDLTGAGGWASLHHLFYVLNATVPYVVLRNFDMLPESFRLEEHGDIDLLVENFHAAAFVTGAAKIFDEPHRVHVSLRIGDEDVPFDFRFVGDQYYDRTWQEQILSTARPANGVVSVPDGESHFYALLYHALIHKRQVASDYVVKFERIAPQPITDERGQLDISRAARLLGGWMREQGFGITVPEPSVTFNRVNALRVARSLRGLGRVSWLARWASRVLARRMPFAHAALRRVHRAFRRVVAGG